MDNITELIERLSNDEDAVKKMAVFKLQTNIGDPSFAEAFIAQGGLTKLRRLALTANGNTLAYSLTSLSRLLELDKGWEAVSTELITRVVELIVTHPLVNILRGAMSILVLIVSHPHTSGGAARDGTFGFRALRPALQAHPQFLEMLVSRLSSADHALCANALQLINSLMRDAIMNEAESEWPKFIKRLQDLGVIKAVFILMQSSALQDLAHPLLEFQALTKVLLRKWRDVKVDLERKEHRLALKGIHLASAPERHDKNATTTPSSNDPKRSKRHNPEKWRRLGFETESPAWEFETVGFLGMMDLTDFVRKHEDGFQKIILEQSAKPAEYRCPVAKGSIAVTQILYELFEVDKFELDDAKTYQILESRTNFERAFRPLLLQWSRMHTASLQAFFRLWKETEATLEDYPKVVELLKVLIVKVIGMAPRTREVADVEEDLVMYSYTELRELQMEMLEQAYEVAWESHLRQVQDELRVEANEFVKEQRIRCLLEGEWFPVHAKPEPESRSLASRSGKKSSGPTHWKFVRLAANRRYLHYQDYDSAGAINPAVDELPNKIDLSIVSSVVSNIIPASIVSERTTSTFTPIGSKMASTKITIHGYPPDSPNNPDAKEIVLLTLNPQTHSVASEWLDGLLMLLSQQPITAETSKLINLIANYGLKIRLLNVRYDSFNTQPPELPSRAHVDEDYYYSLYV